MRPWLNCVRKPAPVTLHSRLQTGMSMSPWTANERRPITSRDSWEVENFCKQGRLHEALGILRGLDVQGSVPSVRMYQHVLQACSKQKDLSSAKLVYSHIVKHALDSNSVLGDLVVITLVNCGSLKDALPVFQRLSRRDAFSWTAIISGYSDAGQYRKALSCYEQMQQEGVQPNNYTFVSLLKACSRLKDPVEARRIHADAANLGLESDVFVGSTLVSMYAKCGSMVDAQKAFDTLPKRNLVSWNAIIAAYAQQGQGEKALQIFEKMQAEEVSADARTYVAALQACGTLSEMEKSVLVGGQMVKERTLEQGKKIHTEAVQGGFGSNVFVANTLVSMYAKCGSIVDAQKVFDSLVERNVVSWNAMIAAHAQQERGEKALQIFEQMVGAKVKPDTRTFVSALQACGAMAEKEDSVVVHGRNVKVVTLQKGKEIHAKANGIGSDGDVFFNNSLVSLYSKCGSIIEARQVFDALSQPTVVSWNALIAGYATQHEGGSALEIYRQMQKQGIRPDARTFVGALQACGMVADQEKTCLVDGQFVQVESLQQAKVVHAEVVNMNLETDMFVGNTLVSTYSKCGSVKDAEEVFGRMSQRNEVTWTLMIAAYAQQDQGDKALQLYIRMQAEGVKPQESTFVSVLEACSNTGALDTCVRVHQHVIDTGLECSPPVASSLVHAYGKCGSMEQAQRVFDSLPQQDVVVWTALIAGYARMGALQQTMVCYNDMCVAGVEPNRVTFVAILSACSHAGMVDEGLKYFESMTRGHGISPELEHYACLIDLLGRAGLFNEAEDILSQMPMQPDLPVWLCLLGACQKHRNVRLGRRAFDAAVGLNPKHSAAYVLMSNIYADAGMLESADEIDQLRQSGDAWKKPGQSWIEHGQEVHTFLVGDHRHEQEAVLYTTLKDLGTQLKESVMSK